MVGLNQETGVNYIQPTKDHGYILVGTAMDPIFGTHSYYVLKLIVQEKRWSKILGDPLDAFGYAIVQTFMTETLHSLDHILEFFTMELRRYSYLTATVQSLTHSFPI